jgi:hypothetical protein
MMMNKSWRMRRDEGHATHMGDKVYIYITSETGNLMGRDPSGVQSGKIHIKMGFKKGNGCENARWTNLICVGTGDRLL